MRSWAQNGAQLPDTRVFRWGAVGIGWFGHNMSTMKPLPAVLSLATAIFASMPVLSAEFGQKIVGGWSYGDIAATQEGKLGSYAQWTSSVGVTVSHMPTAITLFEVECADVKFFPTRGAPLSWALPALGDSVIAVGSAIVGRGPASKIQAQAISGTVDTVSIPVCDGGAQFLVQSGHTLAGMSGGPVFRVADGKAIGITKGYTDAPALGLRGSVFIPYNVIQAAWELAKREVPSLAAL